MSRAYQLDALKRHNIKVSELGCVMLDVETPDLSDAIPEEWEYHSGDPAHWWIAGVQTEGHVTLLHGLLPDLVDRAGVDEVLDGWEPGPVHTQQLEVFRSPFPDEPYACIVARSLGDRRLLDAHARLSLLPHINTYPEYKAHVTLAYVHAEREEAALRELRRHFGARDIHVPITFEPVGLNYGHAIGGRR